MSIYLKKATVKDVPIISNLFYDYYHDFEIFKVSKRKKLLHQAFYKLCTLNTILHVKNNNCYLCFENGIIVGSFILLSPIEYHKPLSETIVQGGFKLWWNCATVLLNPCLPIIGMLLDKLKTAEDILLEEDMKKSWFLDSLTIDRKQAKNRKVIHDIINKIKYVIYQHHGENLKLIVNNDEQLKYFVTNKFRIIHKHIIKGKNFRNHIWLLSCGVKNDH